MKGYVLTANTCWLTICAASHATSAPLRSRSPWMKATSALMAFWLTTGVAVSVQVQAQTQTITIYSGRSKDLIEPILKEAETELGIRIDVKYADTTELAIRILEEGNRSKADLFFAQDAGALGVIEKQDRTMTLPKTILDQVKPDFRSPQGGWVGISGRARVISYNTNLVQASELPRSVASLTDPKWKGKVAWAPRNGSFQSFITGMRRIDGDAKTLEWLKGMKANGTKVYANNTAIIQALNKGEVAVGLVNNYYLPNFKKSNPNTPVANHYTDRDAGSMINVAGMAIMKSSKQQGNAEKLINFLLQPTAQSYFSQKTNEYPLRRGAPSPAGQPKLTEITYPTKLNLSDLDDLKGTLKLMQEAKISA